MITSLTTTAKASTPVNWWNSVFTKKMAWEFKPGINIFWGPNGSGKSTILKLLARLHFCEQLGASRVTEDSLRNFLGHLPRGVTVLHDGQEVRYFNPEKVVGQAYGTFDWDAGISAIQSFLTKGSTGQLNRHRLIQVLTPERPKIIPWDGGPRLVLKRKPKEGEADTWHDAAVWVNDYLKGSIKKGQPTILLDEPDAGMDWPNKAQLWHLLRESAGRAQWIVASHSVYAMMCEGAHYIELQSGYLEECRASVRGLIPSGKEE